MSSAPIDSLLLDGRSSSQPLLAVANPKALKSFSHYSLTHPALVQKNSPELSIRDRSAEARRQRLRLAIRAVVAEFLGTAILFTVVFGLICTGNITGAAVKNPSLHILTIALGTGLTIATLAFLFSGVSGAVLNPAVTIALFATGGLSNRKSVMFVIAQLLGGLASVGICSLCYPSIDSLYSTLAISPAPGSSDSKVFFTEFFATFFLVYVAFSAAYNESEQMKKSRLTVKSIAVSDGLAVFASTPQSQTGFAAFAIGFIVFALTAMAAPVSGAAFNPARIFGISLVSGVYDKWYLYYAAQISGGLAAGLWVAKAQRWGLPEEKAGRIDEDEEAPPQDKQEEKIQ